MNKAKDVFTTPPEKALDFLKGKRAKTTKRYDELVALAHNQAFTVAGVTRLEILETIQDTLISAIDSGMTLEGFKKMLMSRLEVQGWLGENAYRLSTIFNTNVYQAYNAQRYVEQTQESNVMQAVNGKVPFWGYRAILSRDTTKICQFLNGKAVRADDPIWTIIYPLNHYNCRSKVLTLTGTSGWQITTGEKLSDQMRSAGIVIPKGFDSSPVQQWLPDLSGHDPKLVEEYKKHG